MSLSSAADTAYDLVLQGGRVIDPETELDGIRNIAIKDGKIAAISEQPLSGSKMIDVAGQVVAPGFIDLHSHSPTPLGQYYQAFDGVTSALELEVGAFPVLDYGEQINGKALLNYGSSVGYLWIRYLVKQGVVLPHMTSTPSITVSTESQRPNAGPRDVFTEAATALEIEEIRQLLVNGIDQGGLGIGLALDYISEAVKDAEMDMIFDVAGEHGVPVFIHIRRGIAGDPAGLREALAQAKRSGASVHICHITHSGMGNIDLFLAEVDKAKAEGVDVTVEILPYNAGSALISSAVFGRNWQEVFDISYRDVEWAATGERFTEQTWQQRRADSPNGQVIHHYLKEAWTRRALSYPEMIVVSDLLPMESLDKNVAPHNGAFSKILGRYVRDEGLLTLPDALRRMTLLPARRLEKIAPVFAHKGRLQVGMDADITVFDLAKIHSRASYKNPYQTALGFSYVIVNGVPIIAAGEAVADVSPGQRLLTR
ncbi:MAG: N-acyl-D-aspartate/D-glutamate deacylase [Paraglaciecola psychrophila]